MPWVNRWLSVSDIFFSSCHFFFLFIFINLNAAQCFSVHALFRAQKNWVFFTLLRAMKFSKPRKCAINSGYKSATSAMESNINTHTYTHTHTMLQMATQCNRKLFDDKKKWIPWIERTIRWHSMCMDFGCTLLVIYSRYFDLVIFFYFFFVAWHIYSWFMCSF